MDWLDQSSNLEIVGVIAGVIGAAAAVAGVVWAIYTYLNRASSTSTSPASGVRARKLVSEEGGLSAHVEGPGGIDLEKVRTKKDINLTTATPPGGQAPKIHPPEP